MEVYAECRVFLLTCPGSRRNNRALAVVGAQCFDVLMDTTTPRRHAKVSTPLGEFVITADGGALIGAYFTGQKHLPDERWHGDLVDAHEDDVLGEAARQLERYFAAESFVFDLQLAPIGTDFQRSVWRELQKIPVGMTTTYGAIAEKLGGEPNGGLAQGVGQSVGHNPISIIVPCHRVVGADGSMTGFAGGLDRKRWLLAHEEPDHVKETRLF